MDTRRARRGANTTFRCIFFIVKQTRLFAKVGSRQTQGKTHTKGAVPQVSIVRRHEDPEAGDVLDLRSKLRARDAEIAELKAQLQRVLPEGVPPP
jgi:hypothetical protein